MLSLDNSALESLVKKGAKIVVKNSPAPVPASTEITDILQEMRKLSSAAVGILNRPDRAVPMPQNFPTPVVNVSPPAVSISPEIIVQRNNTRYRVTVTQRDNSAQMRIKELIIEPIE